MRPHALATLLVAAIAGALVALAATAWLGDGRVVVLGAPRVTPEGQEAGGVAAIYLVTGHAQLSVPDSGWRPATLRLEVDAGGSHPSVVRVSNPDGFTLSQRVGAGSERADEGSHGVGGSTWISLSFDLDALVPGSSRRLLDLHVADADGAASQARLRDARVVRHTLTPQGAAVCWAGAALGVVAWLLLPMGASTRRRWLTAASAEALWPGLLAALILVPAAAVLPVIPLRHATALVHAPMFGLSVLVMIVAGRVIRALVSGGGGVRGIRLQPDLPVRGIRLQPDLAVGGRQAPSWSPAAWLLVDLVVGIVGLAVAFAWWSLALKRLVGIERVPVWAFPVVAGLALAIAAWRRWHALQLFSVRDALILALIVAALCAVGGPHLATLNGYSSDPDQHVGWTAQVLAHGLLPDRYFASGLYIDYPLGLHAMAAVVSLFGVLPPGTAIAMLPVVASFVSIALFVLGAGRLLRAPDEWTWREGLVGALGVGAMTLALSSSQFSIWQAYQGTGRLASGLVQVVPFLVLVSAVAMRRRRAAAVRAAAPDQSGALDDTDSPAPGRGQGDALHSAGLSTAAFVLCIAGVVALWLNPGLVPLQAVLSFLALAVLTGRARLPWTARARAVGIGLLLGGVIAAGVLAADPWSNRRLLRAAGGDVEGAAAIDRAVAHHNDTLDAASCLTWRCIAEAFTFSRALQGALRPWAIVVLGPIDVARGKLPAPIDAPDAAWSRRFPDITNRGFSPHHGRSAWTFAVTCAALLLVAVTRRGRPAILVLACLLAAASVDVVVGDLALRLIDPNDAQWKLVPPYLARNGSRLLTQAFWATAFGAVGFWLAGVDGRRRRAAGLAAWSALAVWTMVDAGGAVRDGMRGIGLPFRHLRPADLDAAANLVDAHVPVGESLLTPARHVYINERHWLFPDVPPRQDLVGPLHLQSRRASLFLYQFEHGARVSPFDYLEACREMEAGQLPRVIRETRARWALEVADQGDAASMPLAERFLCERRIRASFPAMQEVARQGRVRLYRLWN